MCTSPHFVACDLRLEFDPGYRRGSAERGFALFAAFV